MDTTKIIIPEPKWASNLANIILDLEKLRVKELYGEVPPHIFFQLKNIFQILETLGSARIEGNNTTLAEYVEKVIENTANINEKQREVENIERAIDFIEENTDCETMLDRAYFSQLHKLVSQGLTPPPKGEGSNKVGELRTGNVVIKNSPHNPPDYAVLPDYFEEFLNFVNTEHKEQNQLLMVAVAHHRFAYIHPFDNGNGRMGRLLNYALLIKLGFQVKNGRIINPSSVFYSDRNKYYDMLAHADTLKDHSILDWAEYFLQGLKNEIVKIDSLLSKKYVREKILLPSLDFSLDRKVITQQEYEILKYLINNKKMSMKSEELGRLGISSSVQKSRVMAKLRDKKMVMPTKENGRIYTIRFANNYLLRGIIKTLEKEGFVAEFLNRN